MGRTPLDIDARELVSLATTLGFRPDLLEKAVRLLDVLDTISTHPYLSDRLALKGGTALNLFVLDSPRLSVDIDLNYVGAADREEMAADRPKIEASLQRVFTDAGLKLRRVPRSHAGGKWRLGYRDAFGRNANLETDVNIPQIRGIRPQRLRTALVVYGAMDRKDWRTVTATDVTADSQELSRQLLPLLLSHTVRDISSEVDYAATLTEDAREVLTLVLPFNAAERVFLDRLLDEAHVDATLLTTDENLQLRIQAQPLLAWKALNVRQYKARTAP